MTTTSTQLIHKSIPTSADMLYFGTVSYTTTVDFHSIFFFLVVFSFFSLRFFGGEGDSLLMWA